MRYIINVMILLLICFVFPTYGQANEDVHVSARNAVLIEQVSGRILYEKNAHEIQSIASITKIMTAIIAIESNKMNEISRTSTRARHTEGSSIYLEQGEKMKVEDLVYGLMLRSGNDAAVAIGEHVAGSVEGFVHLMNEKAMWLGMTNTHFDNPHGLDSENHYSTAYDMALLLRYAMGNEQFKTISGTINHKAETRSYAWQNKNRLLTSLYEYCTGGKTGFTKKTGRTLSTTASKNNLNLIAVTLNAPDDWNDHIQMYEWGFKHYELKPILNKGIVDYRIDTSHKDISGAIRHDLQYPMSTIEMEKMQLKSFVLNPKMHDKEDVIGKTIIYLDDMPLIEIPIFNANYELDKSSFVADIFYQFKQIIGVY